MFKINDDMSISVTRGDVLFFNVSAVYKDGTPFKFEAGDILRMRVFEKKACNCVVLMKDFAITEAGESFDIFLSGSDTKIGDIISKPVTYWYEIELNPDTNPQTIVGYDDDGGAKVFRLLPEGVDITEGELDEATKSDVQKIIEETAKEYFANSPLAGSIEDEVNKYMANNPVEDGLTPFIGENGNWWIGITDTQVPSTGNDGEDGADGKDGNTPLFRVNQTTLEWEVSYDNGKTYVSQGVVAKGQDGAAGIDGEDGYTPVKGEDYFTEEDKEGIVDDIVANNFSITTTALDFSNWDNGSFKETLSDGTTVTHTVTCDANGVITKIGDITVSGVSG